MMDKQANVYKRCGCRLDGRRLGGRCPRLSERRHGSWYFTVELPVARDGSRQRVRRGGFRTRTDARQARDYLLGADVDPDLSLVTVGQWLDLWLETRQSLAFSTRRLYTHHIRDYLKPYLGHVPLKDLTIGKIQAMFASLMRTSTAAGGGKPLAASTLHRIRGLLRVALNGAIRRGLIERNPACWVELPSGRRPKAVVWTEDRVRQWEATGIRPPVAVWTAAQTAAFLEHIRGHHLYPLYPLYPLYLLIALLGLRKGEAAGLRWCDLDLDTRVLMVSHQVQDHNGRTVICPPKTESSVRVVALDHVLVGVLRRLRDAHRRQIATVPSTGFLFVNDKGNPLSPGYLTHTFSRLVVDAGLPPIRLHDLRHGAASLSLAAGNDLKTVQHMMGHSSIVLTADTYTSVLPCLAHKAAEATASLVLHAAQRTAHKIRGRPRRSMRRSRVGTTPRARMARSAMRVTAA